MKVLFNSFYYLILAGVVIIGLLLAFSLVPVPGNIEIKVVKSGSMEPAIRTGSIVLIKPSEIYEVGDVITFGPDTASEIPTTHRVIAAEGEGASRTYATQGDANNAPDPVVIRPRDITGKVLLTVPYAGYVLDFAKQPLGFALLVGVPAAAIVIEEVGNIVREIMKIRRRKKGGHVVQYEYQLPEKPNRPKVN